MKIELKHLVPYLPYGLRAKNTDSSNESGNEWMGIKTIIGLHDETVIQSLNNFPYMIKFHISKIKPILRPLSDLTKVIEHNGKSFFPVQELDDCHDFSHMNFQDILVNPLRYPYTIVEKLFEWHFDVFGLIKQGLAIDINTIS